MKCDNVYIIGLGRSLPDPTTIEDAATAGLCDRRKLLRTRMAGVCIAERSGPEMAADAAADATRRAEVDPDEVDLVLHACAYHQGHDLWSPASYVQRRVLENDCPAIEVRQQSNGALASLELAASYLSASSSRRRHALISTGDRFTMPGFDRWSTDPGTIFGDGGTAAVVSSRPGPLRLLSMVSVSDSTLERSGRGDDEFSVVPLAARAPIDLEVYRAHMLREVGLEHLLERLQTGQVTAYGRALADAGLDHADVDWFVLPNLGYGKLKAQFYDVLGVPPERTAWEWGRTVGHLGAGDQFAGLAELMVSGALRPGDRCALIGVGGGFTWSVALVEVREPLDATGSVDRPWTDAPNDPEQDHDADVHAGGRSSTGGTRD